MYASAPARRAMAAVKGRMMSLGVEAGVEVDLWGVAKGAVSEPRSAGRAQRRRTAQSTGARKAEGRPGEGGGEDVEHLMLA